MKQGIKDVRNHACMHRFECYRSSFRFLCARKIRCVWPLRSWKELITPARMGHTIGAYNSISQLETFLTEFLTEPQWMWGTLAAWPQRGPHIRTCPVVCQWMATQARRWTGCESKRDGMMQLSHGRHNAGQSFSQRCFSLECCHLAGQLQHARTLRNQEYQQPSFQACRQHPKEHTNSPEAFTHYSPPRPWRAKFAAR